MQNNSEKGRSHTPNLGSEVHDQGDNAQWIAVASSNADAPSEVMTIDDLMTEEEFLSYAKMKKRDLQEKVRQGKIFPIRFGEKTLRYHPRSIIAKNLRDQGIPYDLIAAMFASVPKVSFRRWSTPI